MAATIKDIARLSGLSVATVSKFINGKHVKEKNRVVLERVIQDLDYRVNEAARALKTNRSRTIGLVVSKFGDVFASELASAIVTQLRKYRYSLVVCESHGTADGEKEAYDFLVSKQVDGIMTTPICDDGLYYKRIFDKIPVPVVIFDRKLDLDICDTVVIDNVQAAYKATRHLIDAGHREIAVVRGPDGHYTADQRFEGFRRAMEEANIPIRPEYVITVDYTDTNMYGHIKEQFAREQRPTAVFSVNYFTTMSTIMAMNELNISVPNEMSIFGFDNYYLSNLVKPRLWLIEQPLSQIAEEGTKMMIGRLNGQIEPETFRTVTIPAGIIEGKSIKQA